MEDNSNTKMLLDDGYVFMNHFIRATDDITEETLLLAWRRGAAIIAPTGWDGGDLVIPIAIPTQNAMSFLMVQVKNVANSTMTDGLKNEAFSALDIAANKIGISIPFVGMFVSLLSATDKETSETIYPALRPSMATRKQAMEPDTSKYNWTAAKPERVVVVTVGTNFDVFPDLRFKHDFAPPSPPRAVTDPEKRILKLLTGLLDCTSEIATGSNDDYYKHLAVLRHSP